MLRVSGRLYWWGNREQEMEHANVRALPLPMSTFHKAFEVSLEDAKKCRSAKQERGC